MINEYLEQSLLQKNRGVYFKKGKWIVHVFCIMLLWVSAALALNGNNNTSDKTTFTLADKSLLASPLAIIPFLLFFYFYCLYLIPVFFKRNRYREFWTILILSILVMPWVIRGFQSALEPYFSSLTITHEQKISLSVVGSMYARFVSAFMGFTTILYLMELLEGIRTSREIDNNIHQLAVTELQQMKSHMNPDFMIRSLDGIIRLSQDRETHNSDAIIYFSDVLRYRLYRSSKKLVMLEEELLQLGDLIRFHNAIPQHENLSTLEIEGSAGANVIPPLSLINIIEPLLTTFEPGKNWSLLIYILLEASEVQIAIELAGANEATVNSMLQSRSKEMLQLLNILFDYTIERTDNNFSIRISFPVQSQ